MKENESTKRSKKKTKKEEAWRSDGPKDPVAMVGVSQTQTKQYIFNTSVQPGTTDGQLSKSSIQVWNSFQSEKRLPQAKKNKKPLTQHSNHPVSDGSWVYFFHYV